MRAGVAGRLRRRRRADAAAGRGRPQGRRPLEGADRGPGLPLVRPDQGVNAIYRMGRVLRSSSEYADRLMTSRDRTRGSARRR